MELSLFNAKFAICQIYFNGDNRLHFGEKTCIVLAKSASKRIDMWLQNHKLASLQYMLNVYTVTIPWVLNY